MTEEKEMFLQGYQPAVITADFDGMKAKLDALLEPYRGLDDAAMAQMETAELKNCRADVNRIIKDVEDARKAIKKQVNEPYSAFEQKVKELLAPAQEYADRLGGAVTVRDKEAKRLKREGLERSYLDFLSDNNLGELAGLIPYERIADERWLNKSFNAVKACDELQARVAKVVHDWGVLQAAGMPFREETEGEYFRTLDLGQALDYQQSLVEQAKRREAFEAQVKENRAASESEPKPTPKPSAQAINRYALTIECTEGQLQALLGYLKAQGIHGKLGKVKQ